MGRDQDCELLLYRSQDLDQPLPLWVETVETGCGLVEQKVGSVVHEHACDAETPRLPAGQTPQWPIPVVIGGLIADALLAAFRSGAQLMEDVDGVI